MISYEVTIYRRGAEKCIVKIVRIFSAPLRLGGHIRLIESPSNFTLCIFQFARTMFFKLPIPSILTSISSPGVIGPMPAGVPVMIRSPGYNVMT